FNVDFALGYMIRYNILTPFGIRYAVETAAKNDCAVVCVGNTWLTEKEETDRFSLKLNSAAEDLILDVAQVNPNVIVVIYAGSAVDVSAFEGKVKAILYMGYCGEGAQTKRRPICFGRVSPCGKLAETFEKRKIRPRRIGAATAIRRYPEGVLVGYKYYEYSGIAPAYPFGYGCRIRRLIRFEREKTQRD
ncbi:MAG: glycoside hydrolase family 3 protein, partial [Eubacteriales bacterium]